MRLAALCAVGMLVPRIATADDKKDAITVVPWTQASLVFAEGDKSASVSYFQLFDDRFMFYGKASAPLDSDTRIAAFTSENKLAKGFSGSFQFGYDERAAMFGYLERRVQLAVEGTKAIREGRLGQTIPFDDFVEFGLRHPEVGIAQSSAAKRYYCSGAGKAAACTDAVVARELCRIFGSAPCGNEGDDAAVMDSATRVAKAIVTDPVCVTSPMTPSVAERDRCFLARWWLTINSLHSAHVAIRQLEVDDETTDLLWQILELVDSAKATELKKEIKATDDAGKKRQRSLILVQNLEVFEAAVGKLKRTNPALARRDLLMTGLLGEPTKAAQSIGVGVEVGYDILEVRQGDLAAKAVGNKKYDFALAVDYTYYAKTPGLSFNARAGAGRSKNPKAKKTELCTAFPSTDPTVTGKMCDGAALFRKGAAPDAETTMSARFALTYQYGVGRSEDEIVPGVELRGGLERTGTEDAVNGRFSLFATPIKGTTAARVGIALDVGYAINIGDADSRWRFTPLVFIGASFSQLEETSL